METSICYCSLEAAYVSSDEPRWKNRILKLAEEYPEDVFIIRRSEENDNCIYAKVPVKWIRIKPPRQMSPEHKAAAAERMKQYHKQANNEKEFS